MLLPIDQPSDELYGLITHELTHVFQYDIIPTSLIRRNIPLWGNEGGAEYERGLWDPIDLMYIRDAAVADKERRPCLSTPFSHRIRHRRPWVS